MESKTPRTDAEFKLEAFFDGSGIVETVFVEFARELETELADKDRQLAEARAEIERLREYTTRTLESTDAEMDDKDIQIIKKDALIEQMKADLQRAKDNFETMDKVLTTQCAPVSVAKAAYNTGMSYLNDALAAERGE